MSQHVLTYEVYAIKKSVDRPTLTIGLDGYGAQEAELMVTDEVAQAVRLYDTIVVTIDVPDDQGDDEPEDAPVYDLLPGGVLAPALPIPHFRLGEVS